MRGIDEFGPTSRPNIFLNIDAKKFAKHYKVNEEDLSLELRQMK